VESIVPERLREILPLNPLYLFIEAHRSVVLYGRVPGPAHTLTLLLFAATALGAGMLAYRRFRGDILDEL
jgi:ABC-type polysaccharide/polyol phosphate export permease